MVSKRGDKPKNQSLEGDINTVSELKKLSKELLSSLTLSNQFIQETTSRFFSIEDILGEAVEKIAEAMEADKAAIYIIEGDELVVKAANGFSISKMRERLKKDHDYWEVIETGEDLVCNNNLVHPLLSLGGPFGVFYIENPRNGIAYTSGKYVGLDNITRLVGNSIQNHNQVIGIVRSFAYAIEAKDPYTRGHSDRVTLYAKSITQKLCGTSSKGKEIQMALDVGGVLHDIGKMGIPDSILHNEGELTDEQYSIIKEHPTKGVSIVEPALKGTLYAQLVIQLIGQHQEWYDGKGYPHGLRGENISLIAQILGVADAFDAMTSERPYREKMGIEKAMTIIKDNRGTQFSPDIVDAFLTIYRDPSGRNEIENIMKL